MSLAELLKKMRQLNLIAASNLEEAGNPHQSAAPTEMDAIHEYVQQCLDAESEGLLIEWSTAYSQYIIRSE